jgi:hypothetical protein
VQPEPGVHFAVEELIFPLSRHKIRIDAYGMYVDARWRPTFNLASGRRVVSDTELPHEVQVTHRRTGPSLMLTCFGIRLKGAGARPVCDQYHARAKVSHRSAWR